MVIGSLNLKLRLIARFSSNVILDEMLSAKCHLLFDLYLIAQHKERPLYQIHMVTSRYMMLLNHNKQVMISIQMKANCLLWHRNLNTLQLDSRMTLTSK